MGERVDIAGQCAVEDNPGVIGGEHHLTARFQIAAVFIHPVDMAENHLDRLLRIGVGELAVRAADVAFDGMRQSVHGGDGREERRQAKRKLRIEHDDVRMDQKVVHRVLGVSPDVGNDRGAGGFRACAGGGRHGNNAGEFLRDRQHDLEIASQLLGGPSGPDRSSGNHLCAVHGRAAAETDHGVAAVFYVQPVGFLNIFYGRVRLHAVIDRAGHAGGFECLKQAGGQMFLHQHTICNHKRFPDVLFFHQIGELPDASRSLKHHTFL
ncbi:MAG: hypothetical protein BWX45_00119 [Deltaproteobacteria bacterium ADurb.Bin002]|nr:MAG: hypothetical protein BWX45_00119 [Deltaproteobacteria bacterium ADurb.Bin002]